jgi:hypothetical protein
MESLRESYLEGLIPISHCHMLDEGDDYYEVFARLSKTSKKGSPKKATCAEGHYYYDSKSEEIITGWRNEVLEN